MPPVRPVNWDVENKRSIKRPCDPVWYAAGDAERAVVFEPGYDSGGYDYGVHGMNIRWLLRGPLGVTQFLVFTSWIPGQVDVPNLNDRTFGPMGADLGYHARNRNADYQTPSDSCEYLNGDPCFYDGSGLQAQELLQKFVVLGETVIWETLQDRYAIWLEGRDDS